MKKLRFVPFLGMLICISIFSTAQTPLFYDDFSNNLTNWTTSNISGSDVWHISGDDGIDGGKCARFYITSNPAEANDDWLISPILDVSGISNIAISFKYWYHDSGITPKFYYSSSYDGDVSTTSWTQLDNSFWSNEWNWNDARIEIANSEESLVFAIRYQSTTELSNYILIDNFKIESYTPPAPFAKVGTSSHFEFYTNITGEENFYNGILNSLENEYTKLSSLWNRPGIDPVFQESTPIKVYYSARVDISQIESSTPNWKCGFHNNTSKEIYLTPLENQQQTDFYGNFTNLAINEFSQLAISCKFLRENNSYFPPYFLEGFGLYESGFRPDRDDVIQYVNDGLEYSYIIDTSGISNNSMKKSLTIANIEGQVLTPWSYLGLNAGASSFIALQWQNYLKHFYAKPESDRLKLQHSSEHFDFYGADSDNAHMTEAYSYFEDACSYYVDNYKFEPEHRFNIVLCPDDAIGGDLTSWGLLGGAGCGGDLVIELSPNFNYNEESYYSDYFGYAGMCAHEFFHIFYNHFMWEIPGGFWAEGTADFSQRHSLGWPIPQHSLWKINALFTDYKDKYNVDINLEHISSNPNGELDIYFLGDMFFEFLYLNYGGFENIKKFFNQGMDYSVFNATYDEIDNGYISFLKSLVGGLDNHPQVTFSVDMQNETVSPDGVFLNGDWNNWETPTQMTADGTVYSATITLTQGETYQYKFLNGLLANPDNYEIISEGDCINPSSGNRELTAGDTNQTLDLVCFGSCSECGTVAEPINVTFQIDMQNETVSDSGVYVNGNWSDNWDEPKKMTDQGNSIYAVVVPLAPEHEYQYGFVNGGPFEWAKYENFSGPCVDEYSSRSFTTTSSDMVLSLTCYNSCDACIDHSLPVDLPFTDDFSSDLSNWMTVDAMGADAWHISPDDGIDGSKCARFYITTDPAQANDDWLISPVFNTSGLSHVVVSFKYWYNDTGTAPDFYFTNSYDGDVSTTNWTPLDNSFWVHGWNWYDARFEITNPGEDLVFAIRYQSTTELSNYILIDNFEVKESAPLDALTIRDIQGEGDVSPYDGQVVKTSGKITGINEFGCFIQDATDIRSGIFLYSPGIDQRFVQGTNIQLIAAVSEYNGRTQLSNPEWIDITDETFYLSLSYIEASQVGEDYEGVFVAIDKLTVVSQNEYQEYTTVSDQGDTVIIDNYLYQPEMEIGAAYKVYGIVDYMYNSFRVNPRAAGGINKLPEVTFSVDMQNETVSSDGVFLNGDWSNWETPVQMTTDGTVYRATVQLTPGETYQYKFLNGLLSTPDNYETISDVGCTNTSSGNRELTPESGDSILPVVCFGRCSECEVLPDFINVTFQVNMQNETVSENGVYVNGDWEDWGKPVKMTNQGNSIYAAVVQLYPNKEYLYAFANGNPSEWDKYENFSGPCSDEYSNHILTTPANDTVLSPTCFNSCDACIDHSLPVDLPFTDDFSSDLSNWTTVDAMGADAWHISPDDGIDGSKCARFYITTEPAQANDDWLISPVFNTSGLSHVVVSFKYWYNDTGTAPDFYYTNSYDGDVSTTNWTPLDNSFWVRGWNWYDARFEIANPGEDLVFAIRYQSTTELSNYILIDNVEVKESAPLDAMTIRDIQGEGDVSPYDGQVVKTSGKITGINEFGCFIQDATDMRSGIFLYSPGIDQRFVQGTNIQLIATVSEYNGRTQLTTPEWIDITDETFYLSLSYIEASQVGEDYEGVFVAIDKLTVVSQNEYQEFTTVSDQGDTVIIDNYLYQPEMEIGSSYKVYGIVDYMYNSFRVNPRAAGGINKLPEVTFSVDMQNETVSSNGVFLNGDWDNWEKPIHLANEGSVYSTTITLTPGITYQYKFLNGLLENPDNYETIPDGGCTNASSGNRELTPEAGDSILPVVCFGSCSSCGPSSQTVAVTFQVDMQNEEVSDDGVYINGSWSEWQQAEPLEANGSMYVVTLELTPNDTITYKFANGDATNWDNYETPVGDCSVGSTNDRYFVVPNSDVTLDAVCFNSCSACVPVEDYIHVTFQVDMQNEDISEDGVFVNGSWSNWTTPVQLVADGSIYEATVAFPPGENIQYKFINGLSSNPGTYENIYTGDCIDSESGNRQLTVGMNDTILGVSCFGSCAACDPIIQTVGITFLLDMQNELVSDSGVYVNGSWDDWQEPIKMIDDGTSIFWAVVQIPEMGTYEYNFVNGDVNDLSNYEQLTGTCANNSSNRTLTVLSEDIILDLVCFGRCVRCETNTAPVAFDSDIQLSEDDSTSFFLNGFDEEDQLDSLTFELVSEPQHAKVFAQNGRAINFKPELNYFGNDQFQFVVKDTEGNPSEIATVSITIEAVNDRPEALPLEIDARGETQIEFDLANYISDVESDDSELTIKFVPENGTGGESILGGTVTLLGGTRYLFETTDPISSEDFIVFRVSDGELTSFSQVVTISNLIGTKSQLLTQENNILTVNDTTDISFNHSVNLEFLGIDLALPFEQLQITVLQQPSLGVLSNFSLNQYNGNILTSFRGTYSCTSNTEALDSIVFEVNNGTETVVGVQYLKTHTVKIAPKLQTIEAQKINEDESLQLAIQVSDMDTELEDLQWELVSTPAIGLNYKVEIEGNVPQLKITPPENYFGNSVLKLIVSDTDQFSDAMSFPLTVVNQNDLPEIQFASSISTYEDDPFSYTLKASDADKDSLFYSFSLLPDWLTAKRVSKYTYELYGTPENKDVDETSVTITVSDYNTQVEQQVTIQVINVDDPPYLISSLDTVFLKTDESVSNLLLSDYFADDDPGAELNYSVTLNSNPEVVSTNILQDDAKLEITPAGVGTSSLSIEGTSDGESISLNFIVKVEVPTAIIDLRQNIKFDVYPNPVKDILHVRVLSGESKWRLEIFNLQGLKLYDKMISGQEHIIDAKKVLKKAGNYLIKGTANNQTQVKILTVF